MTGDVIDIEMRGRSTQLQNELDQANNRAKELKKTISEIEKDGGKGSENWQKYKNELKASQEQAAKLSKELKTLDIAGMTIRQLELHAKDLAKEIKNADRSSQDFAKNTTRLKEVEKELDKARLQAKGIYDEAQKLAKPGIWSSIKGYVTQAFAITTIDRLVTAVIDFGKRAVMSAAEASDAFSGIKKATEMSTEQVVELNKQIGKIDTRTAQADLLAIAQIGGQIGVANDEMLGFVQSVDMAVVALGDEFKGGAEEVATKLGVLSKIFKETKDLKAGEAISKIGSAINELGAAGSATGPVIADFATRMGALGNLSPQISQTLGLGAAFQELGLSSEIASSGLKNILNGAATATKLYADQIGYTEDQFKKLINSSPNDVILKLAASFKGLPTTEVARQMDDLGIKSNEAKSVMSLLANQTERVTTLQKLSAESMEKNKSLTKEFNEVNNNAAATLAKAGKEVTAFAMMIGTYLLPVLTTLTTGFITLVKTVTAIPEFIKENQKAFTALGVAILALNGNNIRAAASAIAHSAAETARTIITKASAIAQNLQLIALVAIDGANKRATTSSYLSIAAEKIRTVTANLVTGAQTALRAITAALTIENIKNTASSTAQSIAEKSRALVTNTVTGAQTLLRTITAALTLENIRSTASSVAHTIAEKARTIATNTVAVAQGLLNVVMKANPIGVVITLVAGLVAGFMKWYDSSQTLRAGIAGLWSAVKAVGTVIADVWGALTSMNFSTVATIIGNAGKDIAKAFTDGYQNKIKEESPKIIAQHKAVVDKKTQDTRTAAEKAADAEKAAADKAAADRIKANNAANAGIDSDQQKANEKALAKKQKQLDDFRAAEEKYEEKIKSDRAKALELAAQMEAENEQAAAETSLEIEESKIREKARIRKKEIGESTVDAALKNSLIEKIDDNARLAIERKQEEFRVKQAKRDQEALRKKQEIESFIRGQEQDAEMVLLDWKESEAKGNAKKLIAVKRERLDVELRLLKENLAAEMEAEKAKARGMGLSEEQLQATLKNIDDRYRVEGLLAVKKNSEDKIAVEKAAHDKKVDILRSFAGIFKNSLSDNLNNLIGATIDMLAVSKKGDKDQIESAQEKYEKMAAAAQAAVNFLNGLAQARAQKAIDEAKRELAERTAVLEQEIAITETLQKAASDYATNLKDTETDRINALETALTAENESELNKRAAASKFYSDQLQMLKQSEEDKIAQMQKMANLAKTDDEKQAIEAKIALARQEAAEKIALAEQQMNQSIADNQKLVELQQTLTSETTTEEQKRSAVKESYSILLQNLMQQQEAHIADLQMQANQAKTADEKAAIEEKIRLAELEKDRKIALMEQERDQKTASLQELDEVTKQLTEKQLADAATASEKQIQMASDEAEQKADFKADLEETIAAENRKARATEVAEKKKAFAAQKKADIATALITGALAVLKALANFFPLNIILAATAAVVTGVQIAKIKNQPDPSFAHGGTLGQVVKGGKHGSEYGTGGIALIDRATGRDVGEMEGDEAIISAGQTSANWPFIQQMFKNARTPGKTHSAVTAHPGVPMAFKDGGKFESPYFERGMYLFGSKKRKAEQAAKDAEAEAAKAQAEADAAMGDMPSFDAGAYGGIDSGGVGGDTASASAAHEAAQKMGQDQLQAILDILNETVANGQALDRVVTTVADLKGSVNGVENAVNSVRDAVYGTNTQGKFDQLIGAISSMSA